jgi:hypothetical protein
MNRERINDRFKLAHHRLVARALKGNPGLLGEARDLVRIWRGAPRHASFVEDWQRLLSLPVRDVRREIVRRSPAAARLRATSPFPLIPTQILPEQAIARLWRLVSRAAIER